MSDRRAIPSLEQLRQREGVQRLIARYGHAPVMDALRAAAAEWRERLRTSGAPEGDAVSAALERDAGDRLAGQMAPSLVRLINATGVVIHTNLGRAPLAASAVERLAAVAAGYSNLEYDLDGGRRGSRHAHAERLLCQATGAEAATVVNNGAAAALIVLAALARGREVIVSRGELVEIGGGFRVPDVMAQSGARLREVGTTNRTRAGDYALAIGAHTAAMLRVHPSNFRMEGFVERPALDELVALGHRFSVPVIEDLGSGWIEPAARSSAPAPLTGEPSVQASIAAGAAVVWFSGDKLLGGPQAGIIVGRRAPLEAIRSHPLMRALRVDKLTYAALEATLLEHLTGHAALTVPVVRMIATTAAEIGRRARALATSLGNTGLSVDLIDAASEIGGGSAPGAVLPTVCVAVHAAGGSADRIAARLRAGSPPVVARIENDRVLLDLRTVDPGDDEALGAAVVVAATPLTM